MKLIEPSVEIVTQSPGIEGVYKQIELAGRTCYKSEDKITDTQYFYKDIHNGVEIIVPIDSITDGADSIKYAKDEIAKGNSRYGVSSSAKLFVDKMIKSGHGAILEHGTVYLYLGGNIANETTRRNIYNKYSNNRYSKTYKSSISGAPWGCLYAFIITNYRVLMQGDYSTWDEAKNSNFNSNWLDDLKYFCNSIESFHDLRISAKFICDRGVSHELVRHKQLCVA